MRRAFALAVLGLFLASRARAAEVVAVLSSDLAPYAEAYKGLQEAYGAPVPIVPLGARIPDEARVVVAFGGKAALRRYPPRVALVYAVAPNALVELHRGATVKIMTMPDAALLAARLKALQPGLTTLAVLWSSPYQGASVERLARAAAERGVSVRSVQVETPEDLPSALRGLKGRAEALWLAPDPQLITAAAFTVIKTFSYENDVPFYAPSAGLAGEGAAAAVFISFEDAGREAAAAARGLREGKTLPGEVFSGRLRLVVDRAAAAEAGLSAPAEALRAADKVLP